MAHYLATSDAADAFAAAFRIPNFLQNLFGEGALSASFIPVYAGLLAREDREEADRMAGAVGALLALVVSVLVLAGVLLAPILVDLLTPGFDGAKRDLTVRLVRILYPGAGLLVLSAWCLGILNSHGRFFLFVRRACDLESRHHRCARRRRAERRPVPGPRRSPRGDRWLAAGSSSRSNYRPCWWSPDASGRRSRPHRCTCARWHATSGRRW